MNGGCLEWRKLPLCQRAEKLWNFFVLEQTTIGGVNYILVTDADEEEDGNAYILRAESGAEEHEQVYSMVEEEAELEAVSGVFENMLEDIDLI